MSSGRGIELLEPLFENATLIHAELQRGARAEVRDVADVVIEALELEEHAANESGAQGRHGSGEILDGLRVGDRMRERTGAAEPLGEEEHALDRRPLRRL